MPKSLSPVVGNLADGIVAEAYTIRPITTYVNNSLVVTTRTMPLYELSDFADNVAGTAYGEAIMGYAGNDKIAAGGGNDYVDGGLGNDQIWGGSGNDQLMGGAGQDMLRGDAGDDVLDGGEGYDAMYGGSGNDLYFVDSVRDSVVELAGEGTDTVITTLAQYTLGANVENVSSGASMAQAVAFTGNELDNRIVGSAFADKLDGMAGNDWLDGGAGDDQMIGGSGDDTYVVGSVGDSVVEAAGAGVDTVRTSLTSYQLGAAVENLIATGRGDFQGIGNSLGNTIESSDGNDALFGGAGNDFLIGWAGDDVLDGGTGADRMMGGSGNDTYWVDSVGDTVEEAVSFGDGQDTVLTTLQDYKLGFLVEQLQFVGNGPHIGRGNELANLIIGADGSDSLGGLAGNDDLVGNGGDDILVGGAGADELRGGSGADIFVFDEQDSGFNDRIGDFVSGEDKIDLHMVGVPPGMGSDQTILQWMGSAAYQSNGVASVRTWTAGTTTFVGVDHNGDGVGDFSIQLDQVSQLQQSDFWL